MSYYICAIVCGIIGLGLDRYTKYLVSKTFYVGERRSFIDGILDFIYVRNKGAAWGMMSNKTAVLIIVTAIIMAVCIFVLVKYAYKNKLLFWAVVFVLSGGMGNMIDRIFSGEVIDFIHFDFWDAFPVFNVADCMIVFGAGLLILYFVLDTVKEIKSKKKSETKE